MYTNVGCWYMYQFVEDLKEEQYERFVQEKKLVQKRIEDENCFYIGFAKNRKLVACAKVFILLENGKNVLYIPLGIQSIVNDNEFYTFLKKYLIITAKTYHAKKITILCKENTALLNIGFKLTKKNGEFYLPLKKEKKKEMPNYFKIVEMDTERKRRKLKEIKRTNKDLFLFNNITFFTLQLDLYAYIDTLKKKEEINLIKSIMEENGDSLILENISIEFFNDYEAQFIEIEEFSSLLKEKRQNILFNKLKEELTERGFQKLFFSNPKNISLPLTQDIIFEYYLSV